MNKDHDPLSIKSPIDKKQRIMVYGRRGLDGEIHNKEVISMLWNDPESSVIIVSE